jgi:hypothetical protein
VPLFRRGDYDVAVLQAFKEVEIAVRKAANVKGAGYADSEIGVPLMRKAFHPDSGPLTDKNLITAEREAEMHLFAGAIGHAKNPPSRRDFAITAQEAARLIIFASYRLNPIEPAFSKFKAHLRKAAERTIPRLMRRIVALSAVSLHRNAGTSSAMRATFERDRNPL